MKTKYCKYCESHKSLDDFRNKLDKRDGKVYKNNSCLVCDNRMQMERHNKKKLDPEYRKKNVERVERYRKEKWDIIQPKLKKRRQTKEYKENRKRYIEQNKQKIYEQEVVCKKKYSDFHRDNLTDKYIIDKLMGKKFRHMKKDFESMPEMIQAKRLQIQILRLTTKN